MPEMEERKFVSRVSFLFPFGLSRDRPDLPEIIIRLIGKGLGYRGL